LPATIDQETIKTPTRRKNIMLKCPYCYEVLDTETKQCPFCRQFFIDPIIHADYKSLEKKKCFFCGKKIFTEAKICRFCFNWLDSVDNAANDYDKI
jgi:RNA polymerase subunit RPABC4/transcription elongation factor Spt4